MVSRFGKWLVALAMSVAGLLAAPSFAQEKTERAYVFGNSLVHHLSDSDETTVPHWLALIAREAGHELALSGQWGFLRDFMRTQPPQPNWSFKEVTDAWNSERVDFAQAGLTNVWIVPANFIQYQSPDAPFDGENAENLSPSDAAKAVIDWTSEADPNLGFYVYEGWPEMAGVAGRFPPNLDGLKAYHSHAMGDYAAWYDTFTAGIAASVPERSVSLIPVSRVLSSVMLETVLSELPAETFYVDDAPHGTASLYLMAAMVVYNTVYNEPLPEGFRPPSSIAPELRATFPMVRDAIWERVVAYNAAEQTANAAVAPNQTSVAPTSENVTAEPASIDFQEPVSDPPLAMGLNGIADWSVQHPFLDLMKSARPWVGHKNDQWGAFDAASIEAGGYLDADGWPKRLPEGARALETFILTDQPLAATALSGRYVLTYEGQGKLDVGGIAKNIRHSDNEIRFDYAPAEGLVAIAIKDTDADDYIRNIKVFRESDAMLVAAGVTFNPAWIARIENLRSLRFMDWMSTNGSISTTWNKRAAVSDYSYIRRGVPAEVMIELANLVGADPWFNMPHMADDTFMRNFAELTQSSLRKDLRAYVEYSNEVWNFLFPQAVYAREQAQQRWGRKASDDAWMQFYGMRSAQMAQIWTEVFGENTSDRLATVIGTHTGWVGLEEASLNAPLWVEEDPDNNWPPYVYFTDYAVTGYFGYEMGSDEQAPKVLGWLEESLRIASNDAATKDLSGEERDSYIAKHKYDVATSLVEQALRDGSVKTLTDEIFPLQAQIAEDHGLRLVMYEGGTHVAVSGEWSNNEALIEFFKVFNYTPEMASIYVDILHAWQTANGTIFNAFVDVAKPSQYGSWGTLRHLQDENPRWDALMAFNTSTPAWWEKRLPNAFEGGRIIVGDAGENEIIGTRQADVLIGLDGDDVLHPLGGKDKLLGGGGFDAALLPGGPASYSFSRLPNGIRVKSNFVDVELIDVEMLWFEADEDLGLMVKDLR